VGLVLAYMGPGEPPLVPAYEFFNARDGFWATSKVFQDCNYLQGNEGNVDPAHLSFLHKMAIEGDMNQTLNARATAPHLETQDTEYGVRIYAIRAAGPDKNYVRVTNFIMPNFCGIAGDAEGYAVNWHVPIDDTHHWRYGIRFNRDTPLQTDRWQLRHMTRNRANRYQQDRESMKTWSFAGLGKNFLLHDTAATEGEGEIFDRSQEHLGYTDQAIVAMRTMMLRAIRDVQEGRDPPHVVRDPTKNDGFGIYARNDLVMPSDVDWHEFWKDERLAAAATTRDGRQAVGVAE
jgi:hypothetical protein